MKKGKKLHGKHKKNCLACSNFVQTNRQSFEQFCERTSIHGMKQLGDRKSSLVERLLWCIIIIVSCCFCFKLMWNSYKKWENYPIITTFARSQTNIWDIPFPAVTVCPEVKTDTDVFNYTDAYLKLEDNITLTEEEQKYYDYLALICGGKESNASVFEDRHQVYENLKEMNPGPHTVRILKRWDYEESDKNFFTPIITSDGICFTFNILDRNDIFHYPIQEFGEVTKQCQWTMEDGYNDTDYDYEYNTEETSNNETNDDDEDSYSDIYPLRTWNAGANGGIIILMMTAHKDLDYICNSPVQGYKVVLHNPGEIPRIKEKFIRVPLDEYVTAAVKPRMMRTSDTLKDYDPDVKECFFQKDRSLSLYKTYSLENCINECLANFTESICGCIEFYIPARNSTPICGRGSKNCIRQVSNYVLHGRPITIKANVSTDINCDCKPPCTSLDFDVELSQAKVEWSEMLKVIMSPKKYNLTNILEFVKLEHFSWLELYMKEEQFMTLERRELYESTDFWAYCGGLLGLCMGVSIFSILEIIYFCILKFLCLLKGNRRGQNHRTDLHELNECKAVK